MMDPVTRQHTAHMMGFKHSSLDLKQAIVEFTSNMVFLGDSDAMQIGGFGPPGADAAQ